MRTYFILLSLLYFLAGCAQKDDDPAASYKNTVWGGKITYKAETVNRVFALSLDDQNNFVWEDISGKYIGKWEVAEQGGIIITFTSNGIKTHLAFNGNQLKEVSNINHDHWTIKQLDKAATPPKDLDDSKWLNEKQWDLTFSKQAKSLQFRKNQGNGVTDGGSITYLVNGPVVNGVDGHFGATFKATFFGVFITEKLMIGNMVYAKDLFTKPTRVEEAYTYLRQQ